ncbi:energy transducer TonB [Flavisolibacter nicotianae]|uniref:energy transducer TonB n=1 Tax=Flavisolibacter nicotianae TaxID=2364882 RepID=UPI000EAC65EC|nr:energy transducer TonB [Flavisolibacter nicotianae]
MEANKILQADLLDLLFEDRNKDYGAYELRRKYNKRITLALVITAGIGLAIVLASFLSSALASKKDDTVEVRDVVVQNIQEEAPPPPPPPPPPPKAPPPPQLETAKFTPPVIKKDEEVRQEEIPPIEKLEEVQVAEKSQEGAKDEGLLNAPPVVDKGTQVVETKPVEDENKVFEKVEIEASVNVAQWRRHLESQLQRYIEDAASSGMNPGTYTVNVRFLVEKDGSITDVRALNDPGSGLAQGAVEVVKRGPKWSPGEQNGRKVRSYHTQPITFVIQEQ